MGLVGLRGGASLESGKVVSDNVVQHAREIEETLLIHQQEALLAADAEGVGLALAGKNRGIDKLGQSE